MGKTPHFNILFLSLHGFGSVNIIDIRPAIVCVFMLILRYVISSAEWKMNRMSKNANAITTFYWKSEHIWCVLFNCFWGNPKVFIETWIRKKVKAMNLGADIHNNLRMHDWTKYFTANHSIFIYDIYRIIMLFNLLCVLPMHHCRQTLSSIGWFII